MAHRGEQFARMGSHGGYTQTPAIGKGFSGSERRAAREQAGRTRWNGRGGGELGNAFARHQELIRNYLRYHPTAQVPSGGAVDGTISAGKKRLSDDEALRRQHRFVRDPAEDRLAEEARGREGEAADPSAWEVRMAAKYYKLLFKEYALADLTRFQEDKVGLRWRIEKDVVSGKGQFECGELRCRERRNLHSYEINFKYKEAGTVKNELVKVRVCPQCAQKLFHKKIKALRRQQQHQRQQEADREKIEWRPKHGSKAGPGSSSGLVVGGESKTVDEQKRSDREGRRGSDPNRTSEGEFDAKAVPGGESSLDEEGHELVLRAVAATGGGKGRPTTTAAPRSKRLRPSRWGDTVDAPAKVATTATGQEGTVGGFDGAMGQTGSKVGDASTKSAARRAWTGELERDRTAEDDMDDYLSSLLL